ncbi:MAG: AAA family ATPase [Planctomycetaceae bacterium]|nr:AAA family ATPase [Planctomycetaceae bacterium]
MNQDVRIPPQDVEAELSVLGCFMLDSPTLDAVRLRPDDFYIERHAILFSTMQEMHRAGHAIDCVTVAETLERLGQLERAGGPGVIREILFAVPHSAHVRYYADIVRRKAQQRELIRACTRTIESAYTADADELLPTLEGTLLRIRETGTGDEIVPMTSAVDALEERERHPAAVHSTGLADLDRQIRGGLRYGQFVVVGGRPGSGKSVLGGQIAKSFAERGQTSLIVSLEMDRAELAERYIQSVDRQRLRSLPIHIVDSAFECERIAGLIRLAKRKHGIQAAVLDYLQLTESEDRRANRERQVAEVSRTMKRLAGELRIPVIAACQLNRTSDRENRTPRLSDLRESGSIEQDADIVVLLHQGEEDGAQAIVAKQRNGRTGIVPLIFRGDLFRFEDKAHGYSDFRFRSDMASSGHSTNGPNHGQHSRLPPHS